MERSSTSPVFAERDGAGAGRLSAAATVGGLVLGLLAGCYNPRRPDCVVSCGPLDACPRGMTCSAGLCTAGPSCASATSAGETHSCALRGGDVLCWGGNRYQQLGAGSDSGAFSPTPVPASIASSLAPALAVAAGGRHTCALGQAGQVTCWGDNASGQLGRGDRQARPTGDVPLPLPGRARALAAGLYHTCALFDDANVRCWGDNRFGQLGAGRAGNIGDDGGEIEGLAPVALGGAVKRVAAGAYHSCALLVDGTVKCWGWNDYGQLGAGDLRSRGLLAQDMGSGLPVVALGTDLRAIDIAAGGFHSCAIVAPQDGGGGRSAGDGSPAAAAGTGAVKCWGANDGGRLGIGQGTPSIGGSRNDLGDALPPVLLATGRTARQVVTGGVHTCVLLDDFSIRCWGYGADGELGIGAVDNRGSSPAELGDALPPVALGAGPAAVALAAGGNHACAAQGSQVTCWGRNDVGQLGVGDTTDRGNGVTPLAAVSFGAPPRR